MSPDMCSSEWALGTMRVVGAVLDGCNQRAHRCTVNTKQSVRNVHPQIGKQSDKRSSVRADRPEVTSDGRCLWITSNMRLLADHAQWEIVKGSLYVACLRDCEGEPRRGIGYPRVMFTPAVSLI